MSFAIFKGETSIKDLVTRLFGLQGKNAQAKADQAAAALLQANPQLNNISTIPVGSILKIPPTAPPLKPAEQGVVPAASRAAAAQQAQNLLNSLNQRLADLDARAAASATALLEAAQSQQTQQAVEKNALAKEDLPSLIDSIQTTLKALPATQEARNKTITDLQARLQLFATR
jgi:hypothetical protein